MDDESIKKSGNTEMRETQSRKNAFAQNAYRIAHDYDSRYGSCPQCVIAAVQETLEFISDDVFKASHALSGGGGLAGDGTCGALAGGMLAISCKYGRERKNFATKQSKPFKLSRRLHDRFVLEYGCVTCRDVQRQVFGRSFNLWDANEYREFEAQGGHRDKCTAVTGNVAKWVVEILIEDDEPNKIK